MIRAAITGVASYVPEKILTNFDLEKLVDTNDEWIVSRTGIRERHVAAEGEASSDMSVHAVNKLLQETGTKAEDIDAIIVATVTPDMLSLQRQHLYNIKSELPKHGVMIFPVPAQDFFLR